MIKNFRCLNKILSDPGEEQESKFDATREMRNEVTPSLFSTPLSRCHPYTDMGRDGLRS